MPASFSPAKEMRLRVLDFGVDKYGLNAYIFDSTNDGTTNYDRVLFSPTKDGADAVGNLAQGRVGRRQGEDHRRRARRARPRACSSRSRSSPATCRACASSTRRSAARSRRGRRGPASPGFTGDFAEYLAQKFPTSTAADFAILEAGVVSEETYVEQGLYWATGHQPMLEYVVKTYKPGPAPRRACRRPTSSSTSSSGSSRRSCPAALRTRPTTTSTSNGVPDGRVAAREEFIRTAYEEADEILTLARKLMGKDPTTFVASDHGFAPQFLAIDASKLLVDLGLLSRPQTSNCRPATGETIGKAKACWAGGARADLPERRGPRSGRRRLHPGRRGRRRGDGRGDQGHVPRPHRSERLDA